MVEKGAVFVTKKQKGSLAIVLLAAAIILCLPAAFSRSLPVCQVIRPSLQDYTRTVSCSGKVKAAQTSEISLSVPVCVGQVYVEEGNYVTCGQKLFDVDKEKMLQILAAGSNQTLDQLEEEQLEQLVSVLGSMDFSAQQQAVPDAVYATQTGTLTSFDAQNGDILAASSSIGTIQIGSQLLLELTVPEDQLGNFYAGCSVVFSPVAYPDREYYASLTDQAAKLFRQLTTTGYKSVARLYASVEAFDEYLADGLTVTAKVTLPTQQGILAVPYSAVAQDENGEYVIKVSSGRAQKQYVTTGLELADTLQITQGVSITDYLLQNAADTKGEGEPIWVKW